MLVLAPVLLFYSAIVLVFAIHLWRPKSSLPWLIALITAILTWLVILVSRLRLPDTFLFTTTEIQQIFPYSVSLRLDFVSWSFALAIVALLIAMLLTAPVRVGNLSNHWDKWAAGLLFCSIGYTAVSSGNLYTLVISWAALDLVIIVQRLLSLPKGSAADRVFLGIFLRLISLMLVSWAGVTIGTVLQPVEFSNPVPRLISMVLIAVIMRLGAVFVEGAVDQPLPEGNALGSFPTLIQAASVLVILVYMARADVFPGNSPQLIYTLASVAVFFSALFWLLTASAQDQSIRISITFVAFAIVATIGLQTDAVLGWSIALLLGGGLGLFYTYRHRGLLPLLVIGAINLSMLPFTPNWIAALTYSPQNAGGLAAIGFPFLLMAQAFILAGYLSNALLSANSQRTLDRWIWLVYPPGLLLLIVAHWIIFIWGRPGLSRGIDGFPPMSAIWPAVIAIVLAGVLALLRRLDIRLPSRWIQLAQRILTVDWLFGILWSIYRGIGRFFNFIELIFEGGGAILWTLLFLVLVVALFIQLSGGS